MNILLSSIWYIIVSIVCIICLMGVIFLFFYEDISNDIGEEEDDIDLWPKDKDKE